VQARSEIPSQAEDDVVESEIPSQAEDDDCAGNDIGASIVVGNEGFSCIYCHNCPILVKNATFFDEEFL